MKVECTCSCGNKFYETQSRIDSGRGKYCSRDCGYKYRVRPSGLKYKIVKENKAWFKEDVIPPTAWKPGETANKNNPNWKGGITGPISPSKLEKQRLSSKVKKWKRQVIKRDGRICSMCKSTDNIEVDHIKPWSTYPELRFDLSNGRVLCNNCHRQTDSYGVRP